MRRKKVAAVVVILAIATGALFARWRARHKINVPALMGQARSAAARGDYSSAKRICHELLQNDPNHAEALLLQSQLAVMDGDSESALRSLRKIGNTPKGNTLAEWESGRTSGFSLTRVAE